MIEFVLAFLVMLIAVIGMAVGVIHGRKPLTGSCGGLNNMGEKGACEICGGDTSKCDSNDAPSGKYYNAS